MLYFNNIVLLVDYVVQKRFNVNSFIEVHKHCLYIRLICNVTVYVTVYETRNILK